MKSSSLEIPRICLQRFFTVSSNDIFKSARLKIDRASEHISDINEILKEKRPFRYIVETDAKVGRRATMAVKDASVVDALSVRSGDAIHNLRSALDHAYGAVVSRVATTDRERRAIQFPFSEKASRLEESCRNRLAHKVSPEFLAAILDLKPHGEPGGNEMLYFMHALDVPDKHAHLVPTAYHVKFSAERLREQIPDFPAEISGDLTMSDNGRDVVWAVKPFTLHEWLISGVPRNGILKQEVNIPVDVCFQGRTQSGAMLTVPTLNRFVDVANNVVRVISRFA
ncbi:hypothetical protein ROE7235_02308 [Roseibaca ekhonensis]|jgi:hypothetical protein|uniref:Uncharacterized protein n=1 Tax=Roseinatronobacter ekhonensis TaxID=254356 RepID=A0A3B0MNC9_9RHOB|nr:hypothetical protein ROE7235_02308 [Roseibaca ekhonensis]